MSVSTEPVVRVHVTREQVALLQVAMRRLRLDTTERCKLCGILREGVCSKHHEGVAAIEEVLFELSQAGT